MIHRVQVEHGALLYGQRPHQLHQLLLGEFRTLNERIVVKGSMVMRYLFDVDLYEYDDWDEKDEEEAKQYYLFFLDKSSYLYETTQTDNSGLNFLLLEPLHAYTNVENGFGLFGAFSMMRVK